MEWSNTKLTEQPTNARSAVRFAVVCGGVGECVLVDVSALSRTIFVRQIVVQ